MLSLITQVLYVTLIPAGLVLGGTQERLAVLAVAAVLALRVVARRRSSAGAPDRRLQGAGAPPLEALAVPTGKDDSFGLHKLA